MAAALPLILVILSFLSPTFLVQSRTTLKASDFDALLPIHKDLGIHHGPERSLCDSIGIFCERPNDNDSHILRVSRLVFEAQKLEGKLSPAIGQLSELKELSLSNNQIAGQIPAQIMGCHKIEVLNLGKNLFSGNIPQGISSLIHLRVLDLSSNRFTGNLNFLTYFPNLEKLNLADNMFEGNVPESLKSFPKLRFINMSGNKIAENDSITKRYSFAESSQGKNQSASTTSVSPSQGANAQSPSPTRTPKRKHKKKKDKLVQWIIGFFAGTLAGCVSGSVFSSLFKLLAFLIKGHKKDTSLKIFSPMIKNPEDLAFLEAMGKKLPSRK